MSKKIAWFSCGAASAVATKIAIKKTGLDVIAYCDTGAEDADNERFLKDCEAWFGKEITRLKSRDFTSTWDVWEKRKYISGIAGAPCTSELKRIPREQFQTNNDVHIFGYTADAADIRRAKMFEKNWVDLSVEFPLIDAGLNKQAVLQIVKDAGIDLPRVYELGYEHANCIPCPKATSPAYWALVRKTHPAEFERMSKLSRKLNARLAVLRGERIFIDEIPTSQDVSKPEQPACDMLCQIVESEILQCQPQTE